MFKTVAKFFEVVEADMIHHPILTGLAAVLVLGAMLFALRVTGPNA